MQQFMSVVEERDALKQETVRVSNIATQKQNAVLAINSLLQLRKELDAFDPSFFEEIEDLKFNYQEALRRNVELEEQLLHKEGSTTE